MHICDIPIYKIDKISNGHFELTLIWMLVNANNIAIFYLEMMADQDMSDLDDHLFHPSWKCNCNNIGLGHQSASTLALC